MLAGAILLAAYGLVARAADPVKAVSIVNPSAGARVSGTFQVQVRVFEPTGLTGVTVQLSTNGGSSWLPQNLTQNTNYALGTNAAMYEVQVSGLSGAYTLVARSTKSAVTTLSYPVPVTVVAAKTGDGSLMRRDNSSQLCTDCHNIPTHSSETTGSKGTRGTWATNCRDCHTPHATTNAFLVSNQITPPGTSTPKDVYFSKMTGVSTTPGATDKPNASFVNPDLTGVCQVCHTRTDFYTSGALGSTTHRGRCADCHKHDTGFKGSMENCVGCHGDDTQTRVPATGADAAVMAAPPRDGTGDTAATDPQVGAHLAHVNQDATTSTLRATPLPCSECHAPAQVGHDTDGLHGVVFGTLATTAWLGEPAINPAYDPTTTPSAPKCSNTYCHGAFTGGKYTQMTWNSVPPGGVLACNTCHELPPPDADHQPTIEVPDPMVCAACHQGFTSTTVDKAQHINGVINLSNCSQCHGDSSRVVRAGDDKDVKGAPPVDATPADGPNGPKVGSHLPHVWPNPPTIGRGWGSDRSRLCYHCHPEPLPSGHKDDNNTLPVWDSPNSLSVVGGASPIYGYTDPAANRVPSQMKCTSTYCHGQFPYGRKEINQPYWGQGPAGAACGSCHLLPPQPPSTTHPANTNCGLCHGAGYDSVAQTVIASSHVDGLATMVAGRTGCLGCHGNPDRNTAVVGGTVDPNQKAAPPWGTQNETLESTRAVGAHVAHVNQNRLSTNALPCTECHPNRTDASHATGTVENTWGPLATNGGLVTPTKTAWDGTTLTCGNYCHGSTLTSGGNRKPASWTGGPGQAQCDSCHPNAFATVSSTTKYHPLNTTCASCHGSGFTASTLDATAKAQHIDLGIDLPGRSGCNRCHGALDGYTPYLPVGDTGSDPNIIATPGLNANAVAASNRPNAGGVHKAHVDDGASATANPNHCTECHGADKLSAADHADGNGLPPALSSQWGPIARAGGMSPSYSSTTFACSNTYCHSKYNTSAAPLWSATGQLACDACHPNAFVTPSSPYYHPSNTSCISCHGSGYTDANTVAAAARPTHVDALITLPNRTGTCNKCHGFTDVGSPGGFVAAPGGAAANAISAPGTPATSSIYAVGAHPAHVNQSNTPMSSPFACTECHGAAETSGTDGHANGDGKPSNSEFGTIAKAGGMTAAAYNAGNCTSTYCHSRYTSSPTPNWNTTVKLLCDSCHPNSFASPSATNNYHPSNTSCTACHGTGYTDLNTVATTAKATHVDALIALPGRTHACNKCHGSLTGYVVNANSGGSADPNVIGAPGTPARNTGTDPGQGVVGAHQAHVNQAGNGTTTFQYMKPIVCTECHGSAKSTASDHADGILVPDMITASLISDAGNMTNPQYVNSGAGAGTCNNTYCHTKYAVTPYAAANLPAPTWQSTGGKLWCNTCHDDPPLKKPDGTSDHSQAPGCSTCHQGYADKTAGDSRPRAVNLTGTAGSAHLDGISTGAEGCTSCHGGVVAGNPTGNAAPPYGAANPGTRETLSTEPAVGAHQKHLAGGLNRAAIQCIDCHPDYVSTNNTSHANSPYGYNFEWSALATGNSTVTATYNLGGTDYTCANYCHGGLPAGATRPGATNPRPDWRAGSGQVSCTSCHGWLSYPYHPTNGACTSCHGDGYTSSAAVDEPARSTTHVNGSVQLPSRNGACNKCHGFTDVGSPGGFVAAGSVPDQSAANAIAAPGTAASTSAYAVGAHTAHVNQSNVPYAKAYACGECHGLAETSGTDGHADGDGTPLAGDWGALTRTGGLSPSYTGANGTCSNTYCHSAYGLPAPAWQSTAGKLNCDACHGDPPASHNPGDTNCASCHPAGYAPKVGSSDPRAVNLQYHIDGIMQVTDASGNADCSSCHTDLVVSMAAGNTSGYHHAMQNADVTVLASGNKYPNAFGDASDANRRCLACHADHDLFSSTANSNPATNARARNLRTDIAVTTLDPATGAGYTNADFVSAEANGGICISCHKNQLPKSYPQPDNTLLTVEVTKAGYTASAHNYNAQSEFSDTAARDAVPLPAASSRFQSNCTKCHNDTGDKSRQTSAFPNQFGVHDSSVRRITNPIYETIGSSTSGIATGTQGNNSVVDTSKAWTANQWAGFVVTISDTNGTRKAKISSNNATSLTIATTWANAPISGTTTYYVSPSGASGTATGTQTNATTIVDTSQSWYTNQFVGLTVTVLDANGTRNSVVTANTATTLTVNPSLGSTPIAGSTKYSVSNSNTTGRATGTQTTTTIQDTTKDWKTNQFNAWAVTLKDPTYGTRTGVVKANTNNTLTIIEPLQYAAVSGTTTYTLADPMEERACMQCHSGGIAGNDVFGAKPMKGSTKRFDQFLRVYGSGTIVASSTVVDVTGTGTNWMPASGAGASFTFGSPTVTGLAGMTADMLGWSLKNSTAQGTGAPHWYSIVKVNSPTSVEIAPPYQEATSTGAWSVAVGDWYLQCATDTAGAWYRVHDVTSATALMLQVLPNAACNGGYVLRSSPGHPLAIIAAKHRPDENSLKSGTATGTQNVNGVVDTSQAWTADQWKGLVVTIVDANGTRSATIQRNTATALTVAPAWANAPVAGTTRYHVSAPAVSMDLASAYRGTATGGTTTTIVDSSRTFPALTSAWTVSVTDQNGTRSAAVSSVTGSTITLATSITTAPIANVTTYTIAAPGLTVGTATGTQSTTTVADTTNRTGAAAWVANQFAGWTVRIYDPTNGSRFSTVKSNTTNTLTVAPAWRAAPTANTTTYQLMAPAATAGTATGTQSAGTLQDTSKAWTTGQLVGWTLTITDPNGVRSSTITANTANSITVSPAFAQAPIADTTKYYVSVTARHVTCSDCHDTHQVQGGRHTPGTVDLPGANIGAWGVKADYPSKMGTATFTGASTTVTLTAGSFATGLTPIGDVNKNLIVTDPTYGRLVFRITAVASATSATLDRAYPGSGSLTGRSVTIGDPTAPPTWTVIPSLTTANGQHELCFKCHSSYAYDASPPKTMGFANNTNLWPTVQTTDQTDVSLEFNPFQFGFHPIMAPGQNQPPTNANANWASSAGRKANAPNAGLDNTFVDGWGAGSRVTCSDCHSSDGGTTDPWGPHGTANAWLLKGIDSLVTVTICNSTANCTTPRVTYPNACYYRGGLKGANQNTGDTKNLCLNCHRADVYGLVTSAGNRNGTSCNGNAPNASPAQVNPTPYANLSRVNHPVDADSRSSSVSAGALTRFGIYCMQCHGGESIGAIHGTNADKGTGTSFRGKRMLNGALWTGHTRATTSTGVACWTKPSTVDQVNVCSVSHAGKVGVVANYDYESGSD